MLVNVRFFWSAADLALWWVRCWADNALHSRLMRTHTDPRPGPGRLIPTPRNKRFLNRPGHSIHEHKRDSDCTRKPAIVSPCGYRRKYQNLGLYSLGLCLCVTLLPKLYLYTARRIQFRLSFLSFSFFFFFFAFMLFIF